jgi:hypothetical protein
MALVEIYRRQTQEAGEPACNRPEPGWVEAPVISRLAVYPDLSDPKIKRAWLEQIFRQAEPLVDQAAAGMPVDRLYGTGYTPAIEHVLSGWSLEEGSPEYKAARQSLVARFKYRAARELVASFEDANDSWAHLYQERVAKKQQSGQRRNAQRQAAYEVLAEKRQAVTAKTLEINPDLNDPQSKRMWLDEVFKQAEPLVDQAAAGIPVDTITGTGYGPAIRQVLQEWGFRKGSPEYQAASRSLTARFKNRAVRELMASAEDGSDSWGMVFKERVEQKKYEGRRGNLNWQAAYEVMAEKSQALAAITHGLRDEAELTARILAEPEVVFKLLQKAGLERWHQTTWSWSEPPELPKALSLKGRLAVMVPLFGAIFLIAYLVPEINSYLNSLPDAETIRIMQGFNGMEWWHE